MEGVASGLHDALAGRGRLVLLMGEPGIGKTRFCDEVTTGPALRGIPVFWGRGWESGGAPAYWPWLDVLAGLARSLDDRQLEDALGNGAALVSALVPELRRRLRRTESDGEATATADETRFQLWRTVVALVRQAAEPVGLVLVFDDLHSTDRSSLLLLLAVARELRSMRVLLLATCRDVEARLDPETGALINRIGREGETLALGRLDRGAVSELLRRRVGEVAPAVATRIFDSTQGNPLFLEEMLRLLGDEGPGAIEAGVVPSGVRDVIRQRLANATGEARAFLELAAVAGDEVHERVLALASGKDGGWIDATIREATRAGVFALRGGRLRFSHALVREVLYGDLPSKRRRHLHGALGRALEQRHSGGGPDDPALPLMELAHHAIEGPLDDQARLVNLAERAAARAIELPAPEEAIALLERAMAALATVGTTPAFRARLLLALGETRIRAGQSAQGTQLCVEAATLARALGDPDLLARAALTYGRVFTYAESDPVLVALLEEALTTLPAGDSPTRARLLARLGAALQPSLNPEVPTAIAREAIATARRLEQPRVLLETLHDGLSALMDVVDPRERRALNLEVETLAIRLGDRERLLRTHARLAIDALALGDLAEADARIEAYETLATALRAPWMAWRAPLFRAWRATMHGRFAEAEQHVAQAQAIGGSVAAAGCERSVILFKEGFLRTAERHAEMQAHEAWSHRERVNFRVWQTIASAQVASRREDLTEVRRLMDLLPTELRPPRANLAAMFFVAEPAAQVESRAVVEDLHRVLLPFAEQYVTVGMSLLQWEGAVARLLALLEERLHRWDEAFAHFEVTIAGARRLNVGPHLARTHYEYGRALQAHGSLERAHEQFEAAHAIATELELPGLLSLIAARRVSTPDANVSAPSGMTAPAPHAAPVPVTMQREGDTWALAPATGAPFRLKDSLGLQYLARLLAEPGREFHVLELMGTGRAGPDDQRADGGDAGELLDDEARARYRERLEDLRETLVEAEAFGDVARAQRAREELAFLQNELARAVGLGGRARRAGGAAERARSAVQRRIKNALQRIGEVHPDLARELGRTVRTGNFCEFRPPPRGPAPPDRS